MTAEIIHIDHLYIEKYVKEFLHVYHLQGKVPASRRLEEIPDKYKSEVVQRIREELNVPKST